jgi:hypothetical protein
MKIIFKSLPICLLLLCFLSTTIQSCTANEEPTEQVADQTLEDVNLFKSMNAIQNELSNNKELVNKIRNSFVLKSSGSSQQFIDQQSLDYLLGVAGISELEISLQEVNTIIGERLAAQNVGYDVYIQNNIVVSSSAKTYLGDIMSNETFINGLELQQQYLQLPLNEQEMLSNLNNNMKNFQNSINDDSFFNDGFWNGSSVGNLVGIVACGPLCGVAGWIIGVVIGSLTK